MTESDAKQALLEEIEAELRLTSYMTGRETLSAHVRAAMLRVPREAFVPKAFADAAYYNRPLPIGAGQTISQPFIVALMTELLELGPEARVLELGTGSGYQAAILAELAAEVYTVERIPELSERAKAVLEGQGYRNIRFLVADGHRGWPEHAPYDAIVVTAAAPAIPKALKGQLAVGGRLLLPLGAASLFGGQMLTLVKRESEKRFVEKPVLEVAFVPLVEDDAPPLAPGAIPPDT